MTKLLSPSSCSLRLWYGFGVPGLLRGTWFGVWVSRRRANGGGDGDLSDKIEGESGEDEGAIRRLGFCASN